MSAKVTIRCRDREYRLKRSLALKKYRRGGFHWLDNFTLVENPSLDPQNMAMIRPFCFGPAASLPAWQPRNSCGFTVLQLVTPRRMAS